MIVFDINVHTFINVFFIFQFLKIGSTVFWGE